MPLFDFVCLGQSSLNLSKMLMLKYVLSTKTSLGQMMKAAVIMNHLSTLVLNCTKIVPCSTIFAMISAFCKKSRNIQDVGLFIQRKSIYVEFTSASGVCIA